MRITRKYLLSVFLLLLFLTPIAAKFGDGLFHHHDHFHCDSYCEDQFHTYHEKCPILSYELSLLSDVITVIEYEQTKLYVESLVTLRCSVISNDPFYLFYLRAPPQYISI